MTRRRPPRPWPRLPFRRGGALTLILLAVLWILVRGWQYQSQRAPPESLAEGEYRVERVVDGDTLLLTNGARIRLIGADTPETVKPHEPVQPFGPEASDFTRTFVARGGGTVRLQFDRERVDKYGRFLAYVYVGDRMLNEELIRAGLARAETGFRYSPAVKARFVLAQTEAQTARRGIWSVAPARPGGL